MPLCIYKTRFEKTGHKNAETPDFSGVSGECIYFGHSIWQREKDSNPHIRSQSPLCYHYTIPLCSLDEHLLLYQRFCICQELNCQFSGFFSFWCRGLLSVCVSAAKPLGRRGREAACARDVLIPVFDGWCEEKAIHGGAAAAGGRPERGLAVSAEGKSANFTDLVKMPIPFCALSCYTAYNKASERSTDHDRNEPQC